MKIRVLIALAAVFSAFGVGVSSKFQTANGAHFAPLAAKCKPASFETAFARSKVVFVGEVVDDKKSGDVRTFDFKVEKYWKGSVSENLKIYAYETQRYQAWFKKGERYLIYATTDNDGKFVVPRCSRSSNIEFAEEDLKKLGQGKIPR